MAKIWYFESNIVRYARFDEDEEIFGEPDLFDGVIEFDKETNENADELIINDPSNTYVENGELYNDGSPIIINPPGDTWLNNLIQESSEDEAANVPGWATWNTQSANEWFTTNIKDPLDTIPDIDGLTPEQFNTNAQDIIAQMQDIITNQATVNKALGELVISLRNKVWPNLQETS